MIWAGATYVLLAIVALGLYRVVRERWLPVYFLGLSLRMGGMLFALLPLIVLPVWLVLTQADIPTGFETGAITGTLVATGWIVAFILREYEGARTRDQTRVDVLVALQQEVFSILEKLDERPIMQDATSTQARIVAGGEKASRYHPVPSAESAPVVFQAVANDIKVLKAQTLEPVLRFYAAYSDLQSFIEDFRSPSFSALPVDRRVAAHGVLTKRRVSALIWGLRAIGAVNAALGVQNPNDINRSGQNPDITAASAP